MRINKQDLIPFGSVGVGECFKYEDEFYMKVSNNIPEVWGLELTSGHLYIMSESEMVEPVEMVAEVV